MRAGRACAGLVLVVSGVALGAVSLRSGEGIAGSGDPAAVIVGGWVAAVASHAAVSIGGPSWCRGYLTDRLPVHLSGVFSVDLQRLEAAICPIQVARSKVEQLELASVALPLAGLALTGPLSLHLAWAALVEGGASQREFLSWARSTVSLTGHAHVALAFLGVLFALRLRRLTTEQLLVETARPGWAAWAVTAWLSTVPGCLFGMTPSTFVSLACLLFVPASFAVLRGSVLRERIAVGLGISRLTRRDRAFERLEEPRRGRSAALAGRGDAAAPRAHTGH